MIDYQRDPKSQLISHLISQVYLHVSTMFPSLFQFDHQSCCLYPHDCSGIVVQSKPPFIDDVPLTTSISTGFSHWNLNWSRIFPARTPHGVQGFSVAWWSPRPRGGGEVHSTAKLVLLCASGKGGVCGLRSGRAWRVHGTSWQQWHPYIFYSHLTSKKIEQPCDLFWWDLTIFDQLLSFWGLLSWFVMEI